MDASEREPRGIVEEPKPLSPHPHNPQSSSQTVTASATNSGRDHQNAAQGMSSALPQEPPPALIPVAQDETLRPPAPPRSLSVPAQHTGGTTSTRTRISSGNQDQQLTSSTSKEKLLESRTPSVTLEHQQLYRERDPEALERERDVERFGNGRPLLGRRDSRGTTIDGPLPPLPRVGSDYQGLRRARTMDTVHASARPRSGLDWIIPVDEKSPQNRSGTVRARLGPTVEIATTHRDKFAAKAKYGGYLINSAIGLQVLLGSLTTGLSAIATTGRGFAIQTTILGGLTTMVAGYLARTRGSNEPELSISRVKDLDKYIREATAFILDYGDSDDPRHDDRIRSFRAEFEELLGNGSGERKLAGPVQTSTSA